MNIVIQEINEIEFSLEEIYEMNAQGVRTSLQLIEFFESEPFLFKGLPARRTICSYMHQELLTLYQVSVSNKARDKMFFISFTCLAEKYEGYKLLFENITSTLRF